MRRFIISVFVSTSILLSVTWSEPERIAFGYGADLAISNDGVLWCEVYPAGVYIYPDEASGWQFETEVEFGGRICIDKGDTLWEIRKGTQIWYKRYDGETWSEQEYVPTAPYNAEGSIPWEPITADSSGGVWVGWTSWEYTVMACNRYQDGVWGGVEKLLDAEPNEYYKLLALSTDALGKVWAGWGKTEYYEPYNSYCEVACNDGTGWSEPMYIGESEGWDVSWLTIAPDTEGGMWVVWDVRRDGVFRVLARYWDGAEWGATDTVAENRFVPHGVVDSYGNAWVVWGQEKPTEDIDIYYSVNSGSGWSEPAPVDENPAVDGGTDIAVDGEGRVWCVWASDRGDSTGIWASYTTSTGVAEPVEPTESSIKISTSLNRLSYDLAGQARLSLYSADGRRLLTKTIEGKGVWVAPGLASGVYFARVVTKGAASNQKLIVLK